VSARYSDAVPDLVFVSVVIAFFAVATLLVRACARLSGERAPTDDVEEP
jgi:hypothetical protein